MRFASTACMDSIANSVMYSIIALTGRVRIGARHEKNACCDGCRGIELARTMRQYYRTASKLSKPPWAVMHWMWQPICAECGVEWIVRSCRLGAGGMLECQWLRKLECQSSCSCLTAGNRLTLFCWSSMPTTTLNGSVIFRSSFLILMPLAVSRSKSWHGTEVVKWQILLPDSLVTAVTSGCFVANSVQPFKATGMLTDWPTTVM